MTGTETFAQVTSFRRELVEKNETIRNSYTYAYSYQFNVAGEQYTGNSKKVQGPLFLENQGNRRIKVYYLACCPTINCPETDFNPWYKIFIYYGVALVLGYFAIKIT